MQHLNSKQERRVLNTIGERALKSEKNKGLCVDNHKSKLYANARFASLWRLRSPKLVVAGLLTPPQSASEIETQHNDGIPSAARRPLNL